MVDRKIALIDRDPGGMSIQDRLRRYVAYWPLFVVVPLICLSIGIFLMRRTVPKYVASTMFLVQKPEKDGTSSTDLIEAAMSGKREINLNNEILLIGSQTLLQQMVARQGFNTSYFLKG